MTIKQYQKLQEIINTTLKQVEDEVIQSGLSTFSKEYEQLANLAKEKVITNMGFTLEEYRAASLSSDTLMDETIAKNTIVKGLQDKIDTLQSNIDDTFNNVKNESNEIIDNIKYSISELELKVKSLVNTSESSSLVKIKELSQRIYEELDRIENSIPEQQNLEGIENRLQQVESDVYFINSKPVDTFEQTLDKINQLKERIKPEAIIGYTDLLRITKTNANLPRDFDVRIGVSKTELKRLTDRVVELELNGGGGGGTTTDTWYQDEVLTRTDGTTYTLAHIPTSVLFLFLNGQKITEDTDFTVTGDTITMTAPTLSSDVLTATYAVGTSVWYEETVARTDGTNYTLAHSVTSVLFLYLNGQLIVKDVDYALSGANITMTSPTLSTDTLTAKYQ